MSFSEANVTFPYEDHEPEGEAANEVEAETVPRNPTPPTLSCGASESSTERHVASFQISEVQGRTEGVQRQGV